MAQQTFWFQGPSWLGSSFPDQPQTLLTKEEARQEVKTLTVLTSPSNSLVDLDNFNSLVKLLRTLCICKVAFKKDLKAIFGREEMALALLAVVKAEQMVHFEAEFRALSNGKSINPKSSIAPLYPFMDNGVIRVGGRLAHGCSMTDDQRFPLLVSHRIKLATLAINDAHLRTLHGGPISEATSRKPTEWQWSSQPKHLFNKLDGEGPLGPVSASARHTGTIIARKLETVHPNPGPTRRGKTKRSEENKKLRNIRRQTKRRNLHEGEKPR